MSETDAGVRLQKVLARAGIGSRRVSEEPIAAGRVVVDGAPAVLGQRIDPARAHVSIDGIPKITDTTLVHWLLNKPDNVVTTVSDPQGRRHSARPRTRRAARASRSAGSIATPKGC